MIYKSIDAWSQVESHGEIRWTRRIQERLRVGRGKERRVRSASLGCSTKSWGLRSPQKSFSLRWLAACAEELRGLLSLYENGWQERSASNASTSAWTEKEEKRRKRR